MGGGGVYSTNLHRFTFIVINIMQIYKIGTTNKNNIPFTITAERDLLRIVTVCENKTNHLCVIFHSLLYSTKRLPRYVLTLLLIGLAINRYKIGLCF